MMKIKGNKFTYLLLCITGILFFTSCKTSTPFCTLFSNSEFLTLKFRDDQKFEYVYYKLDSIGITFDYNKGMYSKHEDSITLYPDTLKNKAFDFELHKEYSDSIRFTRIKIETNITGDYLNKYKIYLIADSAQFIFKGVSVDTILNTSKFQRFKIEIFLADYYLTGTPVPKYKNILTKEIILDTNFNFFTISIPIKRLTYYYKNSGPVLIQDLGNYWMVLDSSKRIPKGGIFLD